MFSSKYGFFSFIFSSIQFSIHSFIRSFIHPSPPTPVLIHKTCERKKTVRRNRGRLVGSKRITGKITGMRHMASADLDTRPVAIAVGQLITSSDGAHRARFFCFHFRPFCRHLFFYLRLSNCAFLFLPSSSSSSSWLLLWFPFPSCSLRLFFLPFYFWSLSDCASVSRRQLSLSFLPYHHINFSLASAAITSHFVSILHIVANGFAKGVI